jgi:ribosomal protein L37E
VDDTPCGGCGKLADPTKPRCENCGYPEGPAMIDHGWVLLSNEQVRGLYDALLEVYSFGTFKARLRAILARRHR